MNKALRQLFTAVVALFVVLGLSTTIITAIKADDLNADSRNTRMLYHTIGAPRGAILASDGTVLAQSDPVNDPFSYQRTYSNGPVYAPVTGYFSITHGVDRGIEASRNEQLNGQADHLHRQPIAGRVGGDLHRPYAAAARLPAAGRQGGRHHSQRPQNRAHPGHGQHPQLRSEPAGRARRRPSQPGLHRPGLPADQPHAQPGHLPAVPAGFHVQGHRGRGGARIRATRCPAPAPT